MKNYFIFSDEEIANFNATITMSLKEAFDKYLPDGIPPLKRLSIGDLDQIEKSAIVFKDYEMAIIIRDEILLRGK